MEEEKNASCDDSKYIVTSNVNRELMLILSSNADVISIHTHIKRVDSLNEIRDEEIESSKVKREQHRDIIDICKLTTKLSSNKINRLVIDTIVPGIIDKTERDLDLPQQNEWIVKDSFMIDNENEVSFGLMERLKYQKLSNHQYKFLKKELDESIESIDQLSIKCNISVSLLNKIKNLSW